MAAFCVSERKGWIPAHCQTRLFLNYILKSKSFWHLNISNSKVELQLVLHTRLIHLDGTDFSPSPLSDLLWMWLSTRIYPTYEALIVFISVYLRGRKEHASPPHQVTVDFWCEDKQLFPFWSSSLCYHYGLLIVQTYWWLFDQRFCLTHHVTLRKCSILPTS